jgi:hypothetical protein
MWIYAKTKEIQFIRQQASCVYGGQIDANPVLEREKDFSLRSK